jgi:peptide methionine sulfoxide reductase MsrA
MNNYETNTSAASCFWGVEDAFLKMKAVKSTRAGYTGQDIFQTRAMKLFVLIKPAMLKL